ncbi:uncharacterized protein LOC135699894 [Ochlerotatus camptorhynchus]|uniref:uncharacterized protein LOC135699894 n=1 Tax=Ochlerotatus camptorhynchus TaxID=644619 RepID=UPI0031D38967
MIMAEDDSAAFSDEMESVGAPGPSATVPSARRNRKKVTAEWSEESTLTLIAAVESQDLLWNAASKDYKNRNLRNTVWEEMAENIFNRVYDGAQLQAKWSNLRIQFKAYHTKAKHTKSGQGARENAISWKYYVAAAEEEQTTESVSNLVLDTEQEAGSSCNTTPVAKKRKKTESSESLKVLAIEGMQRALNKMDGDVDSFQTFGNFVASELRKIPDSAVANRVQRTLTRNLIDLLDEAEYNQLCNQLYNIHLFSLQ